MTYRDLRKNLQEMDDDRLDDDVTIFDRIGDEYIPAKGFKAVGDTCDVLDEGHAVIVI